MKELEPALSPTYSTGVYYSIKDSEFQWHELLSRIRTRLGTKCLQVGGIKTRLLGVEALEVD